MSQQGRSASAGRHPVSSGFACSGREDALTWATICAGGSFVSTTMAHGGGVAAAGISICKVGRFWRVHAIAAEKSCSAVFAYSGTSAGPLSAASTSKAPSKTREMGKSGAARCGWRPAAALAANATAACGTPVEVCVEFVVAARACARGCIAGMADRGLLSSSAIGLESLGRILFEAFQDGAFDRDRDSRLHFVRRRRVLRATVSAPRQPELSA